MKKIRLSLVFVLALSQLHSSPALAGCETAGPDVPPADDEYVVALKAFNGKYVAAECGGDDFGIVNANRDGVGPWETFYLKQLGDGKVALRTIHGRFLAAELGGGDAIHANRQALGPWETFTLVGQLTQGSAISLGTWNGQHYVTSRLDWRPEQVMATAAWRQGWEEFTLTILRSPARLARRTGLVRAVGHSVNDDQGEFNAVGASLFWAAWGYRHDRARLERNLEYLAQHGFHYIRVFGNLGCEGPGTSRCSRQGGTDWWEGREVSPWWPDYDQVIAGLTDLAYDKYGIRIEWTLIGDGQLQLPNESDRVRLIDRFLAMSRGREQKIMHFEIANEAWQNGFPGDGGIAQLQRLGKYMADRTENLVAVSTPSDYGLACEQIDRMYANGAGDVLTFHYDRDGSKVDGQWRPVRQPWETCGFRGVVSNNEPIGPGASVNEEYDPIKLVMQAVVGYVAGNALYVYHTEPGIWGGSHTERTGKSDVYELPVQGSAFEAMQRYLPPGLAGWQRQNSYNNPRHPFLLYAGGQADRIWPEGFGDGVVRAYAAINGNEFVVAPIGIRNFAEMQAKYDCEFDAIHPVTGQVVQHYDLRGGQRFTLRGLEAFVLKGRLK